jgi:hypothetical protein
MGLSRAQPILKWSLTVDLGLKGKRALITGASQGIGLAIAESLAREGVVPILVSRDPEMLARAAAGLHERFSVETETCVSDLSTADGINIVGKLAGEADILVNNAGSIPQGNLLSVDEASWRRAWDLKVFGFINLSRHAYRGMSQRKEGVIINIIGASGERPKPTYIAGTSGNAALMQISKALGAESVDCGVRVIGVNPGWIETDRQIIRWKARAKEQLGNTERWRELEPIRQSPFGRLAYPAEVADVVTFLASERASYISGTVITFDGGRLGRGQ